MRALTWTVWGVAAALAARAQPGLEGEIRSALASVPHAQTSVGVCVVDLESGVTLFERDADRPLLPASNMKVFVMAAALLELEEDFHFETTLATDGVNLYLIGDGDPTLGDEKLCRARDEPLDGVFEDWAEALRARGLDRLGGDLIIDESVFDDRFVNPTWEHADLDNWYAAPVGGLNFNGNCVDITVSPSKRAGAPVAVSVRPDCSLVRVVNHCRSGGKGTPILRHAYDTFEYLINGQCAKRWPFEPVSFPDPGLLTADALRTVLGKRGIRIGGAIRRGRGRQENGTIPASLTIVGRQRTALADVLRRAGKDSQNLFAECLLKRAGYAWARRRGLPAPQGSWAMGSRVILETLARAGIDSTGLAIADGSGLSRENRCTARQLTDVLVWISGRPEGRLFRDSLAVAGVDGSLGKRLKEMPGRVQGKTGTMRGVRTLSGYVGGDGRSYAFAVLFNGYPGPSTPYREIQDRICRALAGLR